MVGRSSRSRIYRPPSPWQCNVSLAPKRGRCRPRAYPVEHLSSFLRQWDDFQGFIGFSTVYFIHLVALLQCDLGVSGAIGEIGVAAGKSFAALAFTRRHNESLLALDMFSAGNVVAGQEKDNVAEANLPMFLDLLDFVHIPPDDVRILKQSSLQITDTNLVNLAAGRTAWERATRTMGFRLFHVDGGHFAEATLHDLNIAACSLVPGGVVLVDDLHNLRWPGVQEGFHRYMLAKPAIRKLEPFLFTGRLFLTTPGYAETYRRALRAAQPGLKSRTLYGVELLVAHTIAPTLEDLERAVGGQRPFARRPGSATV